MSSENLTDECLVEIEKLVSFYMDQRKRMDADNEERKNLMRK